MGYRTVVMLSNDQASEWENDALLGEKIARAMNSNSPIGNYGKVVQCVHGDEQTLAVLDGYTMFQPLAGKIWCRDDAIEDVAVKLLKEAARTLGYRLVKQN